MNLYSIITPATDKLKHFYIGTIVTVISFFCLVILYALIGFNPWLFTTCIVPTVIIAIYKEYIDKKSGKGQSEGSDVLYTILPAILIESIIVTLNIII